MHDLSCHAAECLVAVTWKRGEERGMRMKKQNQSLLYCWHVTCVHKLQRPGLSKHLVLSWDTSGHFEHGRTLPLQPFNKVTRCAPRQGFLCLLRIVLDHVKHNQQPIMHIANHALKCRCPHGFTWVCVLSCCARAMIISMPRLPSTGKR